MTCCANRYESAKEIYAKLGIDTDAVIEKLKNIFKLVIHNNVDLDKVTLESNIIKDLGVNSVGLVYLVIGIEEMFDVDMSEITFNTFETVGDVVKFIKENIE